MAIDWSEDVLDGIGSGEILDIASRTQVNAIQKIAT